VIEKIGNPLDFSLEQINVLVTELQSTYDSYKADYENTSLSLKEDGVSIEITMKDKGTYIYSLAQCKALKAELEDPLLQSLGEVS
jgi:hypothetical protein